MDSPSTARHQTLVSPMSSVAVHSCLETHQTLISPSLLPVTRWWPEIQARLSTLASWPWSCRTQLAPPSVMLQSLTVASPDPVATSLSSGLNSALQTPRVWPRNTDTRLRSRELQSLANLSWPPVTTSPPSGDTATQLMSLSWAISVRTLTRPPSPVRFQSLRVVAAETVTMLSPHQATPPTD